MRFDLLEGLNEEAFNHYEFFEFIGVDNAPATGTELVAALKAMVVTYPSEEMDYKDSNAFRANLLLDVLSLIEGVDITSFSEGGRYWHVDFTYKGETCRIGHDT